MDTKTLCLAVLSQGDTTGYEIKKAFEEGPLSYFQDVSFGSIYPALTRALDEGLVSVTAQPQANRPAKKVYTITEQGRAALLEALRGATAPDRVTSDFLFKLLFSELLSGDERQRLIDARLAELDAKIACMEDEARLAEMTGTEKFVCGFGLAIYRAMRAHIVAECHTLIDARVGSSPARTATAAE